jgi:hypothetical protein
MYIVVLHNLNLFSGQLDIYLRPSLQDDQGSKLLHLKKLFQNFDRLKNIFITFLTNFKNNLC